MRCRRTERKREETSQLNRERGCGVSAIIDLPLAQNCGPNSWPENKPSIIMIAEFRSTGSWSQPACGLVRNRPSRRVPTLSYRHCVADVTRCESQSLRNCCAQRVHALVPLARSIRTVVASTSKRNLEPPHPLAAKRIRMQPTASVRKWFA